MPSNSVDLDATSTIVHPSGEVSPVEAKDLVSGSRVPRIDGFLVLEEIGVGGQASVFRARDEATQRVVAIKVLPPRTSESGRQVPLSTELQAVAQLRHPGVIRLLDSGLTYPIDGPTDGPTDGSARPYIAMEWAESSLKDALMEAPSFAEVRAWLLTILSALGHAHARGVVHCDVKPSNLLLVGGAVKLSDFGIARLRKGGPSAEGHGGDDAVWVTPAYAAPELLERSERIGPWTDLYALGITAFELLTGHVPFRGTVKEILRQHLSAPLPPLPREADRFLGLSGWLATLTAKEPRERFQRAHDALEALEALGAPEGAASDLDASGPKAGGASTIAGVSMHTAVLSRDSSPGAAPKLGFLLAAPPRAPNIPPHFSALVAPAWAPTETDPLERESLFSVRPVPLLGRDAERETLWSLFRRAAQRRRSELCVLRGPSGVGKSHLAQWLGQLTHEAGLANVLVARHAGGGPRAGLRGMWLDYLGTEARTQGEALLVVERAFGGESGLDIVDRYALARFLVPEGARSGESAAEQHALMARLLAACATRPLVLVLDDIQADPAAIDLLLALRREAASAETPMLIVATLEDDVLHELPQIQAGLARVLSEATEIPLGWLDPQTMRALLDGPFGLSAPVAARLAARASGSPLFAVQQVTSWAERGQLRRTHAGFDLIGLDDAPIPEEITAVWRARVEAFFDVRPEARLGLTLAAVLGLDVDLGELSEAARFAACEPPDDGAIAELLRRRLVIATADGFRFVHPLLRETLVVMAREGGRLEALHVAAERGLRQLYPETAPGAAERRARHLRAAQRGNEALEAYIVAIEDASRREDPLLETLLAEHALLVSALEASSSDAVLAQAHRARGAVADAARHMISGQYLRAWDLCSSLRAEACPPSVRIALLCVRGHLLWTLQRGDGVPLLEEALRLAREERQLAAEARCLLQLGHACQYQRTAAVAGAWYEEAILVFRQLGDRWGEARSMFGVAVTRRKSGDDATEDLLLETARLFREVGSRHGVMMTLNERGVVAQKVRRLEDARGLLSSALTLCRTSNERSSVEANLGLVFLDLGAFDEARAHLLAGRKEAEAQEAWGLFSAIEVDLVLCAAELGDWVDFEERLTRARLRLDRGMYAHPDTARNAERAGTLAVKAGRVSLARKALDLALSQHVLLEHEAEEERVRAVIAALEEPA